MIALKGIRVLCAAVNVPGPLAAARLRALGATVVKIEPPAGDPLALVSPDWYAEIMQGIALQVLDLKSPGGRAACEAILAGTDLLLTANRLSTLEALGLNWHALHARHPQLCQIAIVGYGPPRDDKPGHDLNFVAAHGLLGSPTLPRTLAADILGAERAVSEALALILARERGQGAGYRCVSLDGAAQVLAAPWRHGITSPEGALGGALPSYGVYAAKDGHVALAAIEAHFLEHLYREWDSEPASFEEFSEIFLTRTAQEWEDWATERNLPLVALSG